MRSEKPKKFESEQKSVKKTADFQTYTHGNQLMTLFCAAGSGSTAINYLAQDPDLAEREAAVIFEATRKSTK